ncbi:glutathione biosynthesis bifunctional protein gshF [Lentilactobacillus kosonis]|uniref:Glutamate--cysteine ligase n=1 Tax=Lentilactobacillus kosonis TaxID=2810561 RepID=A0A401FNW8_9LACO|nr:glutathione biosynthesis bifunctional protein gshF [Lentilactobacillus kosonis]
MHRYFLTYFLGASPIAEKGFFKQTPPELIHPVRSIRNSHLGYVNRPQDDVNVTVYSSLKHYVKMISNGITKKHLYSPSEFYGPVRLRGQESYLDYPSQGIEYLEFRVFDINPFEPNGISSETLIFLKTYLLSLFVNTVEPQNMRSALKKSFDDNDRVALESPDKKSCMEAEMRKLVTDLNKTVTMLDASDQVFQVIQRISRMIDHPELTPSGRLSQLMVNNSLQKFGSQQALKFKQTRANQPTVLPALADYSNGVQQLIKLLIEIGVKYKLISKNKLQVSFENHKYEIDLSSVTEANFENQTRTMFPQLF